MAGIVAPSTKGPPFKLINAAMEKSPIITDEEVKEEAKENPKKYHCAVINAVTRYDWIQNVKKDLVFKEPP
ncbi:hypothetical protein WICPIJ_009938 [Wickerhamomyces pijperi]|uniref:Uncharacterized protein n=1 Tax=Wickerhamomyces pijperi TaxID=599730 RepID=A0A9P8PKM2_WICPI|nr:hypothetical protein WICPIJ_009938 [Wickerhamomyces pijperi]